MKITKGQLRQIIREKVSKLHESLEDVATRRQRALRRGNRGVTVRELQVKLRSLGGEIAATLSSQGSLANGGVDGDFGPSTKRAVQAFQRSRGLEDDGIVGRNTALSLQDLATSTGDVGDTEAAAGNQKKGESPVELNAYLDKLSKKRRLLIRPGTKRKKVTKAVRSALSQIGYDVNTNSSEFTNDLAGILAQFQRYQKIKPRAGRGNLDKLTAQKLVAKMTNPLPKGASETRLAVLFGPTKRRNDAFRSLSKVNQGTIIQNLKRRKLNTKLFLAGEVLLPVEIAISKYALRHKEGEVTEEEHLQTLGKAADSPSLALHLRGFAHYLLGRTSAWTKAKLADSEIEMLKKIVIHSLTPEGRKASFTKNKESSSKGALINYGVVRDLIEKGGGEYTAIYSGEENKGIKSGLFKMEDEDKIVKFLGAANPGGGKKKIKELQKDLKDGKPLRLVIRDQYDFNDAEKRRQRFGEKGFSAVIDDVGKAAEFRKSEGLYKAIRYLAPLRQLMGYEGYPVSIGIVISPEEYQTDPSKKAKKSETV